MQNNNIDFDFMVGDEEDDEGDHLFQVYPNERHHFLGAKNTHAYERMTNFLRDCLLK